MRGSAKLRGGATAFGAIVIAWCASPPTAATAQQFPTKPVRIMVGFGAGGIADVTMRLIAGKLSERMGGQFIIENRPGAGGINSAMAARSGSADGHTLLVNGNGTALSVSLFKTLPYDILKDFAPVSVMAQFDVILATPAGSPHTSVAKLVEAAKANPGKLNFGTVAAGSTQNLAAEMFKIVTGVQAAVVTFKTSPDLVTALMRGDVDVGFDYLAAFTSSVSDQKIRLIASGGETRSSLTPDVPTVVESGYKDYVVTSWNGVSALAGTPPDVINRLSREINDVLKLPDVRARTLQLGMEPAGTTPEGMDKRMRDDIERWRGVITRLGLQK